MSDKKNNKEMLYLLKQLDKLKKENKNLKERYGLFWEEQEEDNLKILQNKYPILHEYEDESILKDKKSPFNLLIEGDNIHALYTLSYTHKNLVDVIYIDPPYNTKNREFVYNDTFVGEDYEYRHSAWLSFMKKRLLLAHDLLKKSGVIFISIDENEHAQLKLLCDDIFNEKNFVTSIVWQNKYTVSNDSSTITTQTEYILVYAKDINKVNFNNDELREEYVKKNYKNPDNDERGPWMTVQLYKKKNPKSYSVFSPTGKEWNFPWNYNEEGWRKLEKENSIWWGKDGNACPRKKVFLKDSKGTKPKNLWLGEEVGYTSDGGNEIEELFGDRNVFNYPKPLSLIKKIFKISTQKDSVILDFFAGSGTSGHAVLELNEEDGGNRQFILCTNNEISEKKQKELKKNKIEKGSDEWESEGICKKVTYPRLEKVINGYENSKGTLFEGKKSNLKYFNISIEDKKESDSEDTENLISKLNPIISIAENTFIEEMKEKDFTILTNEDKSKVVAICHEYLYLKSLKKMMENLKNYKSKERVIYLNIDFVGGIDDIKKEYNLRKLRVERIPKELLSQFNRLNVTLNNKKNGGEE